MIKYYKKDNQISRITFYAKKKINNLLAIKLESHTTPDNIGCIDIQIYIDKFEYYKKPDRLATIDEILEEIKYALDDLVDKKYSWYPDDYDIDENIPDIIKVDLLQTALIKLLKNEINDMKEYEDLEE